MRRLLVSALALAAFAALAVPARGSASPFVRYGIQDDAWLRYGPGTLDARVGELEALGAGVVRVTLNWRQIEPRRGVDSWGRSDELLRSLHAHGLAPLVTLYGTPRWANGGRSQNWAPTNSSTFAAFAARAAKRYPFVHLWTIWNEPNQRRWLRPTSPAVYTQRLLDPAYAAIHRASPHSVVAGGVTAPRGSTGGVSPVAWIAGMKKAHARLDAFAHNPYPLRPGETPTSGGCGHCATITMATLPRLLTDVRRAFGTRTRIWLTEYGYQTNPPDRTLGVSYAAQARYLSEAALRAYRAPRVDILVHYLVRDEPAVGRWQSGLFTVRGFAKPAAAAFRMPLTVVAQRGLRTTLWGQIRPGGRATFRLQELRAGAWRTVGVYRTSARGFFERTVRAGAGKRFRVSSPSLHMFSAVVST